MLKKINLFVFLFWSSLGFSSELSNELVKIPSGKFRAIWLAPTSKKAKKKDVPIIEMKSFLMMKYPVQRWEFIEFIKKNNQWSKEKISSLFADETYLDVLSDANEQTRSPITSISWFAARGYCNSLSMRLPTTTEWEYVAAASEKNKDANSDPHFLGRILNWYAEPKQDRLKTVGSIYKNKYGIWDMHGLIWEWVEDFNSSFVTGESREDSSFNKDMFCGSGSIKPGDKENYAAFMRFAFRSSLKGRSTSWNLGFRCVRDL